MATTQNTYTGNGSTTAFSFTFPYLEATDIKVSLNAVDTTAYTLSNATTIAFTTAPASGVAIRIYRKTDFDNLNATFYPGSAIRSVDLNNNFTQNLYVTQESDREVDISNTTANTAKATADTALANSTTAVSTANTASTNASAAVSTANTASTNASASVATANTASTNATNAVNTANAASTTANAASTLAAATAAAQTALEADVYDSTELDNGQLDNRYYTETELNAGQLDNRYYTETEIDTDRWNKTGQTLYSTETWSNSNTRIPTAEAVNNRLVDLVNDVGAYVVVSNRTSFPNAGIIDAAGVADSGVLVAVTDAAGITHSGGSSTNVSTINGTAVTITGITTSGPTAGVGVQVLSTSTLHTYTFVRWVISNNVAVQISDNITEILAADTNAAAAATSATNAATSATNSASSATASASSATASSTSATNSAASASAASTSASNAATSASSAANAATAINTLTFFKDLGLITNSVGTTSDYGALV